MVDVPQRNGRRVLLQVGYVVSYEAPEYLGLCQLRHQGPNVVVQTYCPLLDELHCANSCHELGHGGYPGLTVQRELGCVRGRCGMASSTLVNDACQEMLDYEVSLTKSQVKKWFEYVPFLLTTTNDAPRSSSLLVFSSGPLGTWDCNISSSFSISSVEVYTVWCLSQESDLGAGNSCKPVDGSPDNLDICVIYYRLSCEVSGYR